MALIAFVFVFALSLAIAFAQDGQVFYESDEALVEYYVPQARTSTFTYEDVRRRARIARERNVQLNDATIAKDCVYLRFRFNIDAFMRKMKQSDRQDIHEEVDFFNKYEDFETEAYRCRSFPKEKQTKLDEAHSILMAVYDCPHC